MNRILYVDSAQVFGGAEISLLELMRALDRSAFIPHLLVSENPELERAAREVGIPVHKGRFPWFSKRRPWEYPGSILSLAALIKWQNINLVHTNCDHSLRYVIHASRLTCVPYVSHVRDFVRTWFEPEKVKVLNRAVTVICPSEAIAAACRKAGVAPGRLAVVYNPVDIAVFTSFSDRSAMKRRLGIPGEAPVIGLVGQIQPIKGHREFVTAAMSISRARSDVHFVICGAPYGAANERFELELRQQAAPCADKFHFLGYRRDIGEIMAAIDILAVPSWTESFGRVAVEGMAAGCAVVAARVGGLMEVIRDGHDGILIPPKDVAALENALVRLLDDRGLATRLGQNARLSAQRFSIARHVEQMQAIYMTAMGVTS